MIGSTPNVLQIANWFPDHTTLVAAVQPASLENVSVIAGTFNGFCTTNEAFPALTQKATGRKTYKRLK